MLKDNKGITLLAIIITIIILLILTSVSIYVGSGSIKTSRNNTLESELEMVQHAVLEKHSQYVMTHNEDFLVGEKITSDDELVQIEDTFDIKLKLQGDYYRLQPSDLAYLGITNVNDTYVVNYDTGEVLNESKVKTDLDRTLYRDTN